MQIRAPATYLLSDPALEPVMKRPTFDATGGHREVMFLQRQLSRGAKEFKKVGKDRRWISQVAVMPHGKPTSAFRPTAAAAERTRGERSWVWRTGVNGRLGPMMLEARTPVRRYGGISDVISWQAKSANMRKRRSAGQGAGTTVLWGSGQLEPLVCSTHIPHVPHVLPHNRWAQRKSPSCRNARPAVYQRERTRE